MKKLTVLFVVSMLLFVFFGCSNDSSTKPSAVVPTPVEYEISFARSLSPTASYDGVSDNMLVTTSTSTNNGGQNYFFTGYYNTRGAQRSVIKFDISDIPAGATITEAKLQLYCFNIYNVSSMDVTGYKLLIGWDESTSTWASPWTNPGGDFDEAVTDTINVGTLGVNVFTVSTALVQSWLDNPSGNYGILFKSPSEDTGEIMFNSSEDANPAERPVLKVKYTID